MTPNDILTRYETTALEHTVRMKYGADARAQELLARQPDFHTVEEAIAAFDSLIKNTEATLKPASEAHAQVFDWHQAGNRRFLMDRMQQEKQALQDFAADPQAVEQACMQMRSGMAVEHPGHAIYARSLKAVIHEPCKPDADSELIALCLLLHLPVRTGKVGNAHVQHKKCEVA